MFKKHELTIVVTGVVVLALYLLFSTLIGLKDMSWLGKTETPMICGTTVGIHIIEEYDVAQTTDGDVYITPEGWVYPIETCDTYIDPRRKPG